MTDLNNVGAATGGTLIAESQANKATTSNAVDNLLSDTTQKILDKTITTDTTLTDDEFFGHAVFNLSGSPASDFSLFVPASGEHTFIVINGTNKIATIDATGGAGTAVVLRASLTGFFHSDGTDILAGIDPDIMKYDVETIDETADYFLFWDVNLSKVARALGENLPGSGGSGGGGFLAGGELFHARDEKADGTDGGTLTLNTWNVRDLNTVVTPEILGASLGSNQITLLAGTYYVEAEAPAYQVNAARLRLYDTTGTATLVAGQNANAHTSVTQIGLCNLRGRFTLSVTSVIELQHWVQATKATNGAGFAMNDTDEAEIYAGIRIWRDRGQTAIVQTVDETQTVIASMPMASDSAHTVKAWGQGREDATGDTYHFEIFGGARNEGGTSTAPTPNVTEVADAGASTWDVTLEANDTSDEWEILITGEAAHTIDWTVTYFEIVQEV